MNMLFCSKISNKQIMFLPFKFYKKCSLLINLKINLNQQKSLYYHLHCASLYNQIFKYISFTVTS